MKVADTSVLATAANNRDKTLKIVDYLPFAWVK